MPYINVSDGDDFYQMFVLDEPATEKVEAHKVVQDEHISLDQSNNATDNAHLVLQGPLAAGDRFIRCKNVGSDTDLFAISETGEITSSTITDLETKKRIYCMLYFNPRKRDFFK